MNVNDAVFFFVILAVLQDQRASDAVSWTLFQGRDAGLIAIDGGHVTSILWLDQRFTE